jgi:hypothetical protein
VYSVFHGTVGAVHHVVLILTFPLMLGPTIAAVVLGSIAQVDGPPEPLPANPFGQCGQLVTFPGIGICSGLEHDNTQVFGEAVGGTQPASYIGALGAPVQQTAIMFDVLENLALMFRGTPSIQFPGFTAEDLVSDCGWRCRGSDTLLTKRLLRRGTATMHAQTPQLPVCSVHPPL